MEIGTWSNEMAANINNGETSDDDWTGNFPSNIDLCSSSKSELSIHFGKVVHGMFKCF